MRRFYVLVLMSMLCAAARADVVQLANGDRISGAIVGFQSGELQVKTEYAGEVKIKMAAVKEIVSAGKPLHLSTVHQSYEAREVEVSTGGLRAQTASEGEVSVAPGAVQTLISGEEYVEQQRLQHPRLLELWSGSAMAALSASRGNSGATTFNVSATAGRVTARGSFEMFYTMLYSRNTAQTGTSANSLRGGLDYSRNLGPRLFTFAMSNFETDALQNLDLRNVLGGGMGWNLVRASHANLGVFAGGSFDQEFYGAQPARRSGEALVGQQLKSAIGGRSLFSERLIVFPNLSDTGEYRATLESSTTFAINHWLGWQVSFTDTYVSNPPLPSVNNDMLISTGLRFSLGEERKFQPASKLSDFLH